MSTNKKLTQIQLAGTTYDIDLQEDLKLKAQGYSVGLSYTILDPESEFFTVLGRGSCTDSHIKIPPYYKGLPVTIILYNAFYEDMEIQTISIPNTIQTIGAYAFYGSTLSEVYFAEGCHDLAIEDCAFAYTSIREITLPTVTHLGTHLFESSSLEYCYLPKLNNLAAIDQPFTDCLASTVVYLDEEYYNKNKLSLVDNFSIPLSNIIPISDLVTKQILLDNCLKYGGTISDGNGTIQPSASLRNAIYREVIAQYINNNKLHSYATDLKPEDITASGIFSILRPSNDYPVGDDGYPQIYYCITDTGKIKTLIGSTQTTYGVLKLANYFFRCSNSFQASTDLSNLLSISALKSGDLLYAVDDHWEYTISGIKALKEGQANNSVVINEGIASGNTSIAGGTTDRSLVEGLLGGLSSLVANLKPSEAKGALSISLGANNVSSTGGSISIGYGNISGGKGYYVTDFDTSAKTITLSSSQTSTINPGNPNWKKGDRLFLVSDERYWLEVAKNTSSNIVSVTKIPFESLASVNALTSSPNENSVINIDRTSNGVIDIGWGAISIGANNTVLGSNAYSVGHKNIVAGDFGAAFGQENVAGYNAIVSGVKNKAYGKSSASFGANNEVHGKESFVSGEENIVTATRSIVAGSNNTVSDKPNIAVFGRENTVSSETSIVAGINNQVNSGMHNAVFGSAHKVTGGDGMELVSGWDNKLYGGGYGALIGVRNTNQSGNHNIITGRDNTNTSGNRNIFSGDTNESAGDNNAIFGNLNKNGGNNNLLSGYQNTITTGSQNIISGSENKINSGNRNTLNGYGNEITGTNNAAFGQGHRITNIDNVTACGMYSEINSNTLFAVGNGTNTENRNNAFEVHLDGTAYLGDNKIATETYVFEYLPLEKGQGVDSIQQKGAAANGDCSLAFGAAYDFSGSGEDVTTQANASGSIALGAGVVANAEGSFAEGVNTVAGVSSAPKLAGDVHSVINSLLEIPEVKTSIAKRLSVSEDLLTTGYILGLDADKIESVIYEFGGFGSHAEGIQNKAYATGSHAEGLENVVSGYVGHAEGKNNVVSGYNGHAEGFHNTVSGQASHVEGYESTASGYVSHAEGYKTEASGKTSHSEGSYAKATGECAHAEGRYTNAIGLYSHAEGSGTTQNLTGKTADQILQMFESKTWLSAAVGQNSHVEGTQNLAYGQQAHAENSRNLAKGNHSHAEGMYTKALGEYSHTEGFETVARGNQSHAGGLRTIASADSQTVIGRYNKENTNALFIVGNGSSVDNRSNAFEVVEEGINIGGKKSKNSWSLDPGTFDYNSSIRFENNENKYIGIYNHYTSYPMDEDQSYLSLTGYGSSIRLGQSCQINGVTWLQDKCFIDGDLVLNGTDLVIHMGSGTYVTLTAEKLAKIIKFIDSIEEVTE